MKDPSLHRRAFLRASGVAIGLPALEIMSTSHALANDSPAPPARAVFLYVPNGVNIDTWVPEQTGDNYQLSSTLATLSEFKNDFSVLSGLSHNRAKGGHSGADTWLTGADLSATPGYDYRNSVSVDQVAARKLGLDTRIASLELSTIGGTGQPGHSQTLSFNDQGIPMPAEKEPRVVFDRLFSDDSQISKMKRRQRIEEDKSILDAVLGQAKRLHGRLGKGDQQKLDEYLNSVREVENRVIASERWMDIPRKKIDRRQFNLNVRANDDRGSQDYFRTMFDLICLALQTDTTRVCSFQLAREAHAGYVKGLSVKGNHHELSHHGGDADMLNDLFTIDKHYLKQLAYFLDRLKTTPDGNHALLDRTMVLYGSGMNSGKGGGHSPKNLPTLVAGGSALGIKLGQHLSYDDQIPFSNLLYTMLSRLDVRVPSFSESSGSLVGLV